jgi:hypothetical protein
MTGLARGVVIGVAMLAIGGGLLLPVGPNLPLLIIGALLLGSLVWERRYRRGNATTAPHEPGWEATAESFRDDETGKWVRVWFHPQTGERRYVAVSPPGPGSA